MKTGTDPDAGLVNTTSATKSSIAAMDAEPKPSSLPANARITPTETTVYSITATLTVYKLEDDSDYHLVLTDSVGDTMIVEIPHPACVGDTSPFKNAITATRAKFDAAYTATTSFKTANVPVTVTGSGSSTSSTARRASRRTASSSTRCWTSHSLRRQPPAILPERRPAAPTCRTSPRRLAVRVASTRPSSSRTSERPRQIFRSRSTDSATAVW